MPHFPLATQYWQAADKNSLYTTPHSCSSTSPHILINEAPANQAQVARVQKIIAADPERTHVSKNGSFAIALATEMFIQHLATTTHNVVKAERKPRRNIQYRDVASAVAKTDNLEFLVDVVPRTMAYKEFKKKQEAAGKAKAAESGANGQTTLAGPSASISNLVNGSENGSKTEEPRREQNGHGKEVRPEEVPEVMEIDNEPEKGKEPESDPDEPDPAAMQIEMEMRGPRANGASPEVERRTSGFTAINGSR